MACLSGSECMALISISAQPAQKYTVLWRKSAFTHGKAGQRLTTVIVRHPELPAASKARIVIALLPVRSGTLTDQLAVPDAAPTSPNESVHFTAVTPTLSRAVPLMVMLAADVET